jgi:endoglucanase Acf2
MPTACTVRLIDVARWAGATLMSLCLGTSSAFAADDLVTLGKGAYYGHPKSGDLGFDPPPPPAEFRAGAALAAAVPTNQWYSSSVFKRWPAPLYAQPMTYRPTAAGFELGLPSREIAILDDGRKREVRYPHAAALTVAPTAFEPTGNRLVRHSDWLVGLELANGSDAMGVTVLHGSPYSYYEVPRGNLRLRFHSTPRRLWDPAQGTHDDRVLAVALDGHAYAIFAPQGSRYETVSPTEVIVHLPTDRHYCVIAGLPDETDATLGLFLAHAYAFPTETRVTWTYDEKTSDVASLYEVDTVAREGRETTTLMGLYPHQWSATDIAPPSSPAFESVRGAIRIVPTNRFTLHRPFHGILPRWAGLENADAKAGVDSLLGGDVAKADQLFMKQGHGTYWIGKGLGGATQLAYVAEAEGNTRARDELVKLVKDRLESWFDGRHATHYAFDPSMGAFFGYPQEYNSVTNINDHHFHYGYWVQAAALVGLHDPAWLNDAQWGGLVRMMVRDIATTERGRADFPFLRNFDPYESHSWASGTAEFDTGNNQESSSEAVNAWAGLVLLGEALGDKALRDTGIFLYTSEVAAVQEYWFDLHQRVLAPELKSPFASMVFGGKYAYNTWWTEEPRQILGINLLPFTPASSYLGADPSHIQRSLAALPGEVEAYQRRGITDGTPADVWGDVLISYQALLDAQGALHAWNKRSFVEFGETRTHTLFWISSLIEMGRPDFSVTADTALYGVYANGDRRTYMAYNATDTAKDVHFSDGKLLSVAPHSLARSH